MTYSSDGRIISSGDSTVHVWAADPKASIGERLPGIAATQPVVALSPDGQTIATTDDHNESDIAVIRADTGERLQTIATGHSGWITALAWRPDGQALASAGSEDKTVRIWRLPNGIRDGPVLTGATGHILDLAFSPDGDQIATGGYGAPWLWDIAWSAVHGRPLPADEEEVRYGGFSADGQRLLTYSRAQTVSSEPINSIMKDQVISGSAVRVWNTETGALAGPAQVRDGGHVIQLAEDPDALITAAAISPDGRRAVVATYTGLYFRDLSTWDQVGERWTDANAGWAVHFDLAFSPDGRFVASADFLGSRIQLWNVETGRSLGYPLVGHTGWSTRVAFEAQGDYVLSRGEDGWLKWPGPSAWDDELCGKLTSNMTHAEWDEWVSPDIDYQKACTTLDVPQ